MEDFIPASRGGGGRNFHRGGGRWSDHHRRGGRGQGRGRGRGGRFSHHRGGNRSGGGGRQMRPLDVSNDQIEILGKPSPTSLNIAVEGCCHGELDLIYERLLGHQKQTGQTVDLLICCGDFQSHRNPADFHSSSIPPKYRRLGTFPKYYSGEKKAPILTLFIGGNHEASQPLRELYYGGWVAPNIYFMGAAGVVRYGGIRIGGLSGIYKSHDYELGHFERPPFDNSTLRSVYHVRNVDIYRMKCLSKGKSRVDVVVSHDWPLGIEQHGNTGELLRKKPFFRAEVERNDLGSPPNREVLDVVQPKWWFSAHLHVKFLAIVKHQSLEEKSDSEATEKAFLIPSQVKTQRIAGDAPKSSHEEDTTLADKEVNMGDSLQINERNETKETTFHALESSCSANPDLTELMTKFLALDKCLPRRQYLSILHLENECSREEARLEYDLEWLAILRKTHKLTRTERRKVAIPDDLEDITDEDIQWVENRLQAKNGEDEDENSAFRSIPLKFQPTVPYDSDRCFRLNARCPPLPPMGNPQTDFLLDLLELDHILTIPFDASLTPEGISASMSGGTNNTALALPDENEIDIDMEEVDDDANVAAVADENEIELDEASDAATGEGETIEDSNDTGPAKKARLDD